jgi:hypothetical protein
MSPNFARPGVRERAIAEVARSYSGTVLCPDELTTVDLGGVKKLNLHVSGMR